jgi:prepilin peptidase CpaA
MHNLSMQSAPMIPVCLLGFVTLAAVNDLRRARIPNVLTVPAAAMGLLLNASSTGPEGLLHGVGGLLVGLASFLPFYLARGFSAGDVKAMAAIGAFVGPAGALLTAAWILVVGAFGGLVLLARSGGLAALRAVKDRWLARITILIATRTAPGVHVPATDPASHRFPYGLAIASGTIIYLFWS